VVSDTHLFIHSTLEDLELVCLDNIYYVAFENYSRFNLNAVIVNFLAGTSNVCVLYAHYIYLIVYIDRSGKI